MKTVSLNSIYLKGGSYYITQNERDAYRVINGIVFVYIVPVNKGEIGRRTLLCEVKENEVIPAFSYMDLDYQMWRFCFVAYEEATVECLSELCTAPLKNNFCEKHHILNYVQEGFENALVNFYRKALIQEDAYVIRTSRDKEEIKKNMGRLLFSLFYQMEFREKQDSESVLYRMVSVLCQKSRIQIAPYEVIRECIGNKPTVLDIARISHFPCREIVLEENWHKSDAGYLVVFIGKEKEPAVCVPKGKHHYMLYRDGKKAIKLTKNLAEQCEPKAYMIYRALPQGSIKKKDFFKFCFQGLNGSDLRSIMMLTIISALIGLLIPILNQKLYDQYIPMGQKFMVLQVGFMVISFMLGNIIFSIISGLCKYRLSSKVQYQVQNAMYYRVFQLSEAFFRKYESADLANRVVSVGGIAGNFITLIITLGISLITSIFYLWRTFTYSGVVSFVSVLILLLFSVVIYFLTVQQMEHEKEMMALEGEGNSVLFQFIQGIEKVRISGIEERAVYEYMKSYISQRKEETKIGKINLVVSVITKMELYVVILVVYIIVYRKIDISIGVFSAFISALGYISGLIKELTNGLISYKKLQPIYNRIKDLFLSVPETTDEKRLPTELKGNIDINHVSFAYSKNEPDVFQDISLQFREGDYIGIVGESGCGKSTLLKLLLGFETPVSGKIYYDNQDMSEVNLQELRKKFGVVLQDGELISGSIFENIILTAPWAGSRDVDKVVEAVGLSEDIIKMPMGLQTIVGENCNTISGGQKQRILIARAIVNKPKILFFDEATSALDNITQMKVSETLDKLKATRIVIAHRLSTIKNCNRILVFDQGRVVEDGSYQELMDLKGLFYRLAKRQMVDF